LACDINSFGHWTGSFGSGSSGRVEVRLDPAAHSFANSIGIKHATFAPSRNHVGFLPLRALAKSNQRTALPDQCLHSAEADLRPPRRESGFDSSATSTGLKFRSVAVACAISFVPKRGKALSSQTAHGHQAPRPSVFAQDDGRRTEPATTQLRRMVPRVGARPNAA
jgi:hypothetical protein